ncbi:UbiH/UbiF family hydroxylase [Microbaculum marinum]|uniref:UbiH/UbiF family hydroxylase n=1 Tax=Microbaculum marinum TaxID=1764581 RepID=A0AAW9RV41_9HYPH
MATHTSSDVIVAGGGPAGLSAGLALAHAGLSVTVVDPARDPSQDRRTSALMVASVTMLEELGVWGICGHASAPLERMRIIDDTGRLFRSPSVEFAAGEIGEPAFGWNIPNAELVAALRQRIGETAGARTIAASIGHVDLDEDAATVTLTTGESVSAPLLVAADGRNSMCRAAAGIGVDDWSYDQAAIVLDLEHERPHGNVSTEFHRPSGPFTLVPLPGNRSSLVWVETPKMADALSTFDDEALAEEIMRLSHRILGKVRITGPRGLYPLSGLVARRFAAKRVALVGEAGHVVPPIGAQGLNLGLRDAASIAEIAADAVHAGEDPGGKRCCGDYDRARRIDVVSRAGAIDLLNRTLLADLLPAQMMRAAGLSALGSIGPLRRIAMREGVSPGYRLPRLMRRQESALLRGT